MTTTIQPVIMAGGSGTRLWPLSRAQFPKQFLVLHGQNSLFQQAAQRMVALRAEGLTVADPIVVGNDEHRFVILEQLREIGLGEPNLLLEPLGRNTAPALTLAALDALERNQDPLLVVTPADHAFADEAAFTRALRTATSEVDAHGVVVFGVPPDQPETGFGYIQARGTGAAIPVERFVEKPDLEAARRYLAEGGFYWNSGIFVLKASTWISALQSFRPDILEATRTSWKARQRDGAFVRPGREAFEAIPSQSIDYAVIEKCPQAGVPIHMVPLDAGWSDLGAWDAVWQLADKDAQGNAAVGDVVFHDCRNSLVHAGKRLVGVVGLEDVVVVETADAVLVADRRRTQDVKHLVSALQASGRSEQSLHRQVTRPWGWYDSVDAGERFQVKRIVVKPGASLSLQMHHHRAEHWIVVSGTAEVTVGDKVTLLAENQSTYIPLGHKHRLRNPGKVPLELIEVQSGSYLGEDDIVRFEDTYGRT